MPQCFFNHIRLVPFDKADNLHGSPAFYIGKTGSVVERAEKELKAFKKIRIAPNETANVSLAIPVKDLAYYDVNTKSWVIESGQYKLFVGTSSGDISQISTITVK